MRLALDVKLVDIVIETGSIRLAPMDSTTGRMLLVALPGKSRGMRGLNLCSKKAGDGARQLFL